jgi:hypothetical protein
MALGVWVTNAAATILVFDQMREAGLVVPVVSGNGVPQDYGDRVAGTVQAVPGGQFTYDEAGEGFTPNVVAEYFATGGTGANQVSLWHENYGDLINVVFGNQNSGTLTVRLTADAGFDAQLYHFDLGGWSNADFTVGEVRVRDAVTTVFSASNVLVEGDFDGPRHTSFDFPLPLSGSELLIEIDYSNLPGNQQDNIGIDNIRFGQDPPGRVPEPSASCLICICLCAFCAHRRRRRVGG